MIVKIDGWVVRVFPMENRKYYAREVADHCQCAWCRNFYSSVDGTYPQLRPFLEQFGVHIEAPDEMIALSPTLCAGYYAVCGEILERGEDDLLLDGLSVMPLAWSEAKVDTLMEEPLFFLRTDWMTLPWVLEEPMNEADSPAKGKNFIARVLSPWITE